MKRGVNAFHGLSSDTAYESATKGIYIEALDVRITTDTGESQGAVTNVKGNSKYFDLPTAATEPDLTVVGDIVIIGAASIRNKIVLFMADDSNINGWIYTFTYDDVTNAIIGGLNLKFKSNELNFSKKNPIEALGNYESDCIQKVYWTDYNNFFRSVNVEDPNLLTSDVGVIDNFPDIKYNQPLLQRVLGAGVLLCGVYQYAYRLITFDGKETLISPPSNLIHTVKDSESLESNNFYNGNLSTSISFKSNEILIDTSDYQLFKEIELISIYHSAIGSVPEINIVETKQIDGQSEVIFLHTGNENTIIPIEISEYTTKQYPFKTPKTITTKDNSLVIANIKGSQFDIQSLIPDTESFSALTKRYDENATLEEVEGQPGVLLSDIDAAFNVNYNKDAHWQETWHTGKQYKFQLDGLRLGGQGPNISYSFHLEPYVVDTASETIQIKQFNGFRTDHDLNDGYGIYKNTSFDTQASPFISGLLKGYKRGETYRFGIVFYNKKGESSFVEYIGDIKFPDISDEDSVVNDSTTNYFPLSRERNRLNAPQEILTDAFAMGIKFDINFGTSPALLNGIESYQIVRLERTERDNRRLCSGIMKVGMFSPILNHAGKETGEVVDLSASGSQNVVHLFNNHISKTAGNGSAPEYGANANFALLNDDVAAGTTGPILGSFVTFHSPDVSHQFGSSISKQISEDSLLLITGRYGQYYSSSPGFAGDYSYSNNIEEDEYSHQVDSQYASGTGGGTTADLGIVTDTYKKMRTTGRVDKTTPIASYLKYERGIEYIKKWNENAEVSFNNNGFEDDQNNADLGRSLGPYAGFDETEAPKTYYFRNFNAITFNNTAGLNWNQSSTGTAIGNSFSKGASGIIGTIAAVDNDYYTQLPVSPLSPHNKFPAKDIGGLVTSAPGDILSPAVLVPTTETENLLSTPCIDVVIPLIEQYGGYSTEALEQNKFIIASPVIDKVNTNPIVYGGDIFLNMWCFQESVASLDRRFFSNDRNPTTNNRFINNVTSTNSFVVESKVNTELSYGSTPKTFVEFSTLGGPTGVTHSRWRQETDNASTIYGKTSTDDRLNMYLNVYNTVFSTEQDELIFIVKPLNSDSNCLVNDTRAYISNVKINSETIDSWVKFGIANFYDVLDNGPINRIINHKDEVYFFQDNAVGKYSINPRAVTSTDDGIPTELGSAKGFQDHAYISTKYGAIHQWAVTDTESGIYFWDGIRNKLIKTSGGAAMPISEMKGMHGFLKNMKGDVSLRKENEGDNPILNKGVHLTKDMINNEVLITFLGVEPIYSSPKVTKYTLVFDEAVDGFSSLYSAVPPLYIENNDILISVNPTDQQSVYKHHSGEWGNFYDTVEESSITMILNSDADANKILRTVEFNSIVRDDNKVIDRTKTITSFKVETEYQTTGKIPFSTGRIKRKFDKWRLKIPRDQNNGTDRLRSTHFILTLYFDNTDNKELILNRIIHYYDIQQF